MKVKATFPLLAVIVIVGMFGGRLLSDSMEGSRFEAVWFMILVAVCVVFIAYSLWIMIASSGKVKVADSQLRRSALTYEANPEKAVVYLSRPQTVGFAVAFPAVINGKDTLWMKGKNFYRLELPAGSYAFSGNKKCKEILTVGLKAGEVVYLEQEILMGMLSGGYCFKVQDDVAAAHKGIGMCKLLLVPDHFMQNR